MRLSFRAVAAGSMRLRGPFTDLPLGFMAVPGADLGRTRHMTGNLCESSDSISTYPPRMTLS